MVYLRRNLTGTNLLSPDKSWIRTFYKELKSVADLGFSRGANPRGGGGGRGIQFYKLSQKLHELENFFLGESPPLHPPMQIVLIDDLIELNVLCTYFRGIFYALLLVLLIRARKCLTVYQFIRWRHEMKCCVMRGMFTLRLPTASPKAKIFNVNCSGGSRISHTLRIDNLLFG